MKQVAAIVIAIFFSIALAGCGGGGETASTEASSTIVTGEAASATAAPVAPEPDKIVPWTFEKKPTTPAFFIEALNKDQPIFVLFYGADEVSQDLLIEAKKLVDDEYYGGGATFLLMKVDDNDDIKKLERDFNLGYVPYMAVVNRAEQIIFEKNGYIDSKVLEQALYDAMNK